VKRLLTPSFVALLCVAGLRAETEVGYWDLNSTLVR
jgi:hypothetical protein